MEYLVTMTTHVPDGTTDQEIDDVRARESVHSAKLAEQGHFLRIWRPPLGPGEWRSIGLFAADDADQLEQVLASMPLRIWRTDEVTPLAPHPNDPNLPARGGTTEFLTTFTIKVPDGTPEQVVAQTEAREAQRAAELGEQGHLERLWRLPSGGPDAVSDGPDALSDGPDALGLWRASDAAEMRAILKSLPLDDWMTVRTTPLTPHPGDPARLST
jgi:muconolactone delta-isomerase